MQLLKWYNSLPRRSRLSLSREFSACVPMAIVYGVMSNSFVGLVGRKALGMNDTSVAILQSMNLAGFVVTGIGSSYLLRYSKPVVLKIIFLVVSVLLTSVYAASFSSHPSVIFIFQIFLLQTLIASTGTLRSAIWRKNYPDRHRARMLVAIYLTIGILSSLSAKAFGRVMDLGYSYGAVYLICAGAAILTSWRFSHLRVSNEVNDLRRYLVLSKQESSVAKFFSGMKVLKDDPRFRRYMSWQFLNGLCCLSIEHGTLILIISNITDSYERAADILVTIHLIVAAVASPLWARFFDSKDIFTVRTIAATCWATSRIVLAIGLFYLDLRIIIFSRVLTGISMALGQLAWRLGHMTFAPPEKDGLYMSAHLMLTGIRGMLAPFVGIMLLKYSWAGPNGTGLVLLSAAGLLLSAFAFHRMKRDYPDLINKN